MVLHRDLENFFADRKYCLLCGHQPRIRQIRDNAVGRKRKLNEYVDRFTCGQAVSKHELDVPRFKAPLPYLAGRKNYGAVGIFLQPSLKARGDSVRFTGTTYISTENRQWRTILAVDCVSDGPMPVSKKMTTLLRNPLMLRPGHRRTTLPSD